MALPLITPTPDDHEMLRLLLEHVRAMRNELDEIRGTLERYRPLLELAEARMTGPKFFGRGAPRVNQNGS